MTACYLRMGDDPLDDARWYPSVRAACDAFEDVARDLNRFGQKIEASVHRSDTSYEVAEYPDYVIALGPKGGLRRGRT